jgi:hypothetical protein
MRENTPRTLLRFVHKNLQVQQAARDFPKTRRVLKAPKMPNIHGGRTYGF